MKRMTRSVLLLIGLLAIVPAVFAGGWATVTLDQLPGDVHATEPFAIGFTVLQHGIRPVHDLGEGYPVKPLIVASNAETGERIEFAAQPTEEIGHFAAEITIPAEGLWEWSITPHPFGEQVLEPLTVQPAPQAALMGSLLGANGGLALTMLLRWAGIGLAALGLTVLLWQRRRATPTVRTEG